MINKVIIEGWINNLQPKRTQDGKPVAVGQISTPRSKDEQTGKWIYDYINFTAYESEAEFLLALGNKAKVVMVGRWRHDSVQDPSTLVWKNYDKLIAEAVASENLAPEPQETVYSEIATPDDITLNVNSDDLPF